MGRFFSNFILTIILLVTFKLNASESNDSCTIYLKNGQNIVMKFREVQSFCFVNDKGEGINYSVIDSLITSDSTTAQTIFQSCPGIFLDLRKNEYVLKFLNCVPLRSKQESLIPFKPSYIAVTLRTDPSSQIGFMYDAELFNIKNFIHRFQGAIGFRNKKSFYSSMVFAFGLGYQFIKNDLRYSITTNYGLFRESPEFKIQPKSIYYNSYTPKNEPNAPAISGAILFISPVISHRLSRSSPYSFTIGIDFCFYRERHDLPKSLVTIYLGVGTDL